MKKLLAMALAASLTVAGICSAGEKILRVGTESTFAPFEYTDEKGEIIGFDIDLIRAMAREAGYKADIQFMGFDGLIPAVQSRILDCAISGMTITEARSKVVTFSDSYYTSGLLVLVRKDNKDIKGYADLKGKRIACQIGTTGENKSRQAGGSSVTAYNNNVEACMELVAGGADAVINDAPVVAFFLKTPAGVHCKPVGEVLEAEEYGIAFNKADVKLVKAMNKALANLRKTGEYDKIYNKWFK